MKSARLSVFVAVLVVAGIAVGTSCRHRFRHDPEKMKKHVTYFVNDALDDLQATPSQRAAVLAAKDRLFERSLGLHADGRMTARAFLTEWERDTPDADRVHALIDERAAAMTALAHQAAAEVLAVHGILTPEQRAQVAAKITEGLQEP